MLNYNEVDCTDEILKTSGILELLNKKISKRRWGLSVTKVKGCMEGDPWLSVVSPSLCWEKYKKGTNASGNGRRKKGTRKKEK